MSTFWYKFRYIDLSGKKHTDSIKASSIKAARQYIVSKRYKLLSIRRQYEIELYVKRFKKTKAWMFSFHIKTLLVLLIGLPGIFFFLNDLAKNR